MRPGPGRKTPGLVTLRESRVNAAKEQSSPVSDLMSSSIASEIASAGNHDFPNPLSSREVCGYIYLTQTRSDH